MGDDAGALCRVDPYCADGLFRSVLCRDRQRSRPSQGGLMRFGVFFAPFHASTTRSPVAALARDIETTKLLDRLGYEEAWFGEHHSCGTELISSPEIFIANLAPQTTSIKLGTGVLSLPYHNPLGVADRAILLDYLPRGRFMLGLGPGSLPTDAAMIGLDSVSQRGALEEDTDVLM